jgi:hypothetical protein
MSISAWLAPRTSKLSENPGCAFCPFVERGAVYVEEYGPTLDRWDTCEKASATSTNFTKVSMLTYNSPKHDETWDWKEVATATE